jgi:membrane protein DedA with SNARE-associated domain
MKTETTNPSIKGYKEKIRDHAFKTIFILSFLPRIRLLTPIFVALAEIKFKKFISYSMISLAGFCTAYISLGYFFHRSISSLVKETNQLEHYIFFGLMITLTIILSIIVYRKFK